MSEHDFDNTHTGEDDREVQPAPECGCGPNERPRKSVAELSSTELGREGERMATSYLQRRGYEILDKNWRFAGKEADIVARDGGTIVLVEVKTRLALGESSLEMPELAVDRIKQEKYRTLGFGYLALHKDVDSLRFDVIALNIIGEHNAKLRHLVNAFGWDE